MIHRIFAARRASALVAVACVVPFGAAPWAQERLDEILVTADFRERAAADIPTSVTILDANIIERSAVQHFEEMINQVPNLNWSGDGHRARYLQIRGVGELAQYQGAPNPSVGFIVDDIDFSGIGTIATVYDVERIEVLRGPQGTRYGANALAGLIYVRSAEPTDELEGEARVGVGDDNEFSIGAAMGGPIGTRAGFRLSLQQYESDGFRRNPYLARSDTNGRDEFSLRGKLNWETSNDWTLSLTAMLSDIDNGYDAFAIDNSLTVLSDNPGKDAQRSIGTSLRAVWTGSDAFDLTSITAIADSDIDFSFDADWGNENAWDPVTYDYVSLNDRSRTTINQEFRFTSKPGDRVFNGRATWLAGLFVSRLEEDLETVNRGDYFDPGFNFADSLDDRIVSAFEAQNAAVFGQLDFDVGDAGVFSVGLRVENRSTDYSDSTGLTANPDEAMVGGELSYRHTFRSDLSAYVSLSRGYKAGGFNLGFVPAGQRDFGDEVLWNLEAGIKSAWLNDRLRLSGAVFYNKRLDQQVETSFQLIPNDPASFVFFTDNAAEGSSIGLEAEALWLATEKLQLFANIGLLRAEFDEFNNPLVDLAGRDQAHAPRYTFNVGGVFNFTEQIFARLDIAGKDEFFFDVSHDQKSDSFVLTSLRIGYEAENWTAQVYARNLFDEEYAVRGFYFGNEPPNFPTELFIRQGDPRQVGILFEMRY